jgi:hypothetical protein
MILMKIVILLLQTHAQRRDERGLMAILAEKVAEKDRD